MESQLAKYNLNEKCQGPGIHEFCWIFQTILLLFSQVFLQDRL